ncbi:MAG: hypothetical protein WC481_07630 [Candidatus Omnitrophota bacterium]
MNLANLVGRWVDTAGDAFGFKNAGGMPRYCSTPYLYQIAEGNIPGHYAWSKMGYNASVDSAAPEDLWAVGGTFTFPPSPIQLEVVSDSGNDTAAGTGIQQVQITYLDTTYVERTEIVTLNGATEVPTAATNILRINNFRAYRVGTGKVAAGNVDIRETDDSPVYSRIGTGMTRARNAAYTVPLGKTLYITSARFSSTGAAENKDTVFTVRASYDDRREAVIDFMMPIIEVGMSDAATQLDYEFPIKLPAKVDMRVIATAGNNTSICTSVLRGWMEDE